MRSAVRPLADQRTTTIVGAVAESPVCRRCGLPVVAYAADFEVFEQMHYVCFHYAFEHQGDPDLVCAAGGCPAAGVRIPSLLVRTQGVQVAQAGNTVVPAILALRRLGFRVEQQAGSFVASTPSARFTAENPVALLGLVKLIELRGSWRASDEEIDQALSEFEL